MITAVTQPMLATLVNEPFDDKRWVFETKWDGFRLVAENGAFDQQKSRPPLPQPASSQDHWNATSAKLRSLRECKRSHSWVLSFSSAFNPISRCCPTRCL
jgi:hypothetical protein